MAEKDYFVPFERYGEDNFIEKRSKFTGRLWHGGGCCENQGNARGVLGCDA